MANQGDRLKLPGNSAMLADIAWKLSPAGFAVRLSQGRWHPFNYLQLLSRKLVDVAYGRCRRLIITMPPRHGKSECVSHWFPGWYLETFPENRVILCSYEAEFAAKWGGKVRDTIMGNYDILSLRLKSRKPAMHFWETEQGGAMMCAGVGGPITGKGAHVFVVDDFVKNAEEAGSRTIRENIWDWWTSTARTRLEPNGAIIIMATRWHSDDLIGRLIDSKYHNEKGSREEWEVFNFPALATPDSDRYYASFGVKVNNLRPEVLTTNHRVTVATAEREIKNTAEWRDMLGRGIDDALCPDRYDTEDLRLIRGSVGERDWNALYQQMPGNEAAVGNVYYAFAEHRNCKDIQFDPTKRLAISLDFNVDPMCAVVAQYDANDPYGNPTLEILEEVVLPNSNTYQMCAELVKRLSYQYAVGNQRTVEVYGDAAGTQRTANSPKSNWQIVAEHFSKLHNTQVRFLRLRANPTILDRVNAVNTLLCSADGTVRMFVNDLRCPELIKDFKRVKFAEDGAGNTRGGLDKSDGARTHVSDAMGYFAHYRFLNRRPAGGRKGALR